MILFYILVLVLVLSSVYCSTVQNLSATYATALEAIRKASTRDLKEIFSKHASDLNDAINRDLVNGSLLFTALFRIWDSHINASKMLHLFAEYGVEMGNPIIFRKSVQKYCGLIKLNEEKLALIEELLTLNLIEANEFWLIAIDMDSNELVQLIRGAGGDFDYRIPSENVNVLGRCVRRGRYGILQDLIKAGADVNLPPNSENENIWQMILPAISNDRLKLLPLIASQTENLFTPFYGNVFYLNDWEFYRRNNYPEDLDSLISTELEKRLAEGRIDLLSFDRPCQHNTWTLLDRLSLHTPLALPVTVEILRDAKMPMNFPLSCAFAQRHREIFRQMIRSGQANCNEKLYHDEFVLSLMLDSAHSQPEDIELLIEGGASVRFPYGFKYRNALFCLMYNRRLGVSTTLVQRVVDLLTFKELEKEMGHLEYLKSKPTSGPHVDLIHQIVREKLDEK